MNTIILTFGDNKSIVVRYGDEMVLFIDTLKKIQNGEMLIDLSEEDNNIVRKAGYDQEDFYKYILRRINGRHLERGPYCLLTAVIRRTYEMEETDPRWISLLTRIEAEYFLKEISGGAA